MLATKAAAALGAPAAGLLAIHFYGFSTSAVGAAMAGRSGVAVAAASAAAIATKPMNVTSEATKDMAGWEGGARGINAEALGKGLFLSIAFPYCVGVVLITLAFFSYSEDRRRARTANWVDDCGTSSQEVVEGAKDDGSLIELLSRRDKEELHGREDGHLESSSMVRSLNLEGQRQSLSNALKLMAREG